MQRARQTRILALLLIAIQTCLISYVITTSGYNQDDYLWLSLARAGGFSGLTVERGVFGSFNPGFQIGDILLASLKPIPRWPAVLVTALLYGACLLAFYRLLTLLIGNRPIILPMIFCAGLSGLLATSIEWWTAALNSLPAVACDLLALDALIRYALSGNRRHLWVSVLAFGVGIQFYEPSVTFIAVLLTFDVLFLAPMSGSWSRRLSAILRPWWKWPAFIAPVAFDLGWRVTHPNLYALPPLANVGALLRFIGLGWAEGFVPMSFGIHYQRLPHSWQPVILFACQGVLVGIVLITCLRRRAAWRAWVVFAAGFAALEVVAAIGRGHYGSTFAINTVYWALYPFLLLATIALAVFPNRIRLPSAAPSGPHRDAGLLSTDRMAELSWATTATIAAALVMLGAFGLDQIWTSPSHALGIQNRNFAANASASWSAAQKKYKKPFVWNTEVPAELLAPAFAPSNVVASTVGLLLPLRVDASSGQGLIFNGEGQLIPARAEVLSRAVMGAAATGTCLAAQPRPWAASLPLTSVVTGGNWFVRIDYSRSSRFDAELANQTVPFTRGRGAVLVGVSMAGQALVIGMPAGGSVCITQADVEQPEPLAADG